MSRILNGLLGRGLALARGYTTRPTVIQRLDYSHPEKRRTFPLVYFNRSEMPQRLAAEETLKKKAEIGPEIVVSSGDRPLRRRGCLRHLIHNRGNTILNDMQRWSEFRRKIIYGVY